MEAAQTHCASQYIKFSNYVEKLIQKDLELAGKLKADEAGAELAFVRELIATKGIEAVRAKLAELGVEAANREVFA